MRLPTSRWLLIVVVVFAGFHLRSLYDQYQANSWLAADGSFYFTTLRAITERHQLEQRVLQPQSWYVLNMAWNKDLTDDWSNVALGRNGGWYPKHSILLPLLSVPLYLIFGVVGTLITNVLLNLAFVLLAFLLARRFVRIEVATIIGCVIAAQPYVLALSYSFSNDLLTAVLLLGSLELVFAGWFGWAGVIAGVSIWSRITNFAFLPGLIIIGLDQGGWRSVRRAILFSLMPLGLYGAFNAYLFGAPWITSYQRVLVREDGVQHLASHARLFNVPWADGLRHVLLGDEGIETVFPLVIPGLAGLLVLGWRRWATAFGVFLFMILPAAAFVKYQWYRPQFLYPSFGASSIGIAAILGAIPWFEPREIPPEPRPSRVMISAAVTAMIIVVVGGTAWRVSRTPSDDLLSSHIHDALVSLGGVPCDYWNPQAERWECASLDQGGQAMTGTTLQPGHVHGAEVNGIWMTPGIGDDWRHIRFLRLSARSVDLTVMLDDESQPGPVDVEIQPRGYPPMHLTLTQPGERQTQHVDIGDGTFPALELKVRSLKAAPRFLIVEGQLHS